MKFDPWSDCIDLGSPTNVKNLIRALTIVGVLIFLSGIASGKRVDVHMIVNKYAFPVLVFGKGPTQSIRTLLKGSSKAGIGRSGAGGIFWLGLPTTWHIWHDLQYSATSFRSLGQ